MLNPLASTREDIDIIETIVTKMDYYRCTFDVALEKVQGVRLIELEELLRTELPTMKDKINKEDLKSLVQFYFPYATTFFDERLLKTIVQVMQQRGFDFAAALMNLGIAANDI